MLNFFKTIAVLFFPHYENTFTNTVTRFLTKMFLLPDEACTTPGHHYIISTFIR